MAKALTGARFDLEAHRRVHSTLKSLFTRAFLESQGDAWRSERTPGLPWNPACLAFHETQRTVRTNPVGVRQPIYDTSVGRWRRYESHLGPLKAALGDLVTAG